MRVIAARDAPAAQGGYAQAVAVCPRRLLFVSGQIPEGCDGHVPAEFGLQCRMVWANLEAQLRAGDMSLDNLVKITTYLADRRFGDENGEIRRQVLGHRTPALTVVIAGIYDPRWLLEIEAVAAE